MWVRRLYVMASVLKVRKTLFKARKTKEENAARSMEHSFHSKGREILSPILKVVQSPWISAWWFSQLLWSERAQLRICWYSLKLRNKGGSKTCLGREERTSTQATWLHPAPVRLQGPNETHTFFFLLRDKINVSLTCNLIRSRNLHSRRNVPGSAL